jgi:hypothetical protein
MNGSLLVNKHMNAYDVCDASSGYCHVLWLLNMFTSCME